MPGKLVVTFFDAGMLYNQWEHWEIDMSIRISNCIEYMVVDKC